MAEGVLLGLDVLWILFEHMHHVQRAEQMLAAALYPRRVVGALYSDKISEWEVCLI